MQIKWVSVLLYQYVCNEIAVNIRGPISVKRAMESLFPDNNMDLEMKTEKGYNWSISVD